MHALSRIFVSVTGESAADPVELDLLLLPVLDTWVHSQLLTHNSPIASRIVFTSAGSEREAVAEIQARIRCRPVLTRPVRLDALDPIIQEALKRRG
jgi:hypothetical protein